LEFGENTALHDALVYGETLLSMRHDRLPLSWEATQNNLAVQSRCLVNAVITASCAAPS